MEPRTPRHPDPEVPDDVTGAELDRQVRGQLSTLSKDNALGVARHLVMVARLLDEHPDAAYAHAMAAQRRAGRVAVVREAAGLAAYHVGRYDEALRELRTARRLNGSQEHLPVMADCERGLGRPERALAALASPEARSLDRAGLLELTIVAAGARLDLGQAAAAVVLLQVPELTAPVTPATAETQARLMSAYADALAAAGRGPDAQQWLERAAAADVGGVTGAAERLGADDDIIDLLIDLDDDAERPEGDDATGESPTAAGAEAPAESSTADPPGPDDDAHGTDDDDATGASDPAAGADTGAADPAAHADAAEHEVLRDAPPDHVPGSAVAEDVAPEDAGPEDVGPEDVAPGDAGPEDVAPGDAGPEDVAPGDAGPEDVAPGDVGPEDVRR